MIEKISETFSLIFRKLAEEDKMMKKMKQNIINDKHGWKHKLPPPPTKLSMYANINVNKEESSSRSPSITTSSSSSRSSFSTASLPRNLGIFSGIRKYAKRNKERIKEKKKTPISPSGKVSFKSDIDVKVYESNSQISSEENETSEEMDTFESNDMNNNVGDLKEKIEHLGMELNSLREANTVLEMELRY